MPTIPAINTITLSICALTCVELWGNGSLKLVSVVAAVNDNAVYKTVNSEARGTCSKESKSCGMSITQLSNRQEAYARYEFLVASFSFCKHDVMWCAAGTHRRWFHWTCVCWNQLDHPRKSCHQGKYFRMLVTIINKLFSWAYILFIFIHTNIYVCF